MSDFDRDEYISECYAQPAKRRHKHAELIKAWADGAEIQMKSLLGSPEYRALWIDTKNPNWGDGYCEFRIKPEPDVVDFVCLKRINGDTNWAVGTNNLKLTFDGETGELKSAEVLK